MSDLKFAILEKLYNADRQTLYIIELHSIGNPKESKNATNELLKERLIVSSDNTTVSITQKGISAYEAEKERREREACDERRHSRSDKKETISFALNIILGAIAIVEFILLIIKH
jgi:hypothetical protein